MLEVGGVGIRRLGADMLHEIVVKDLQNKGDINKYEENNWGDSGAS